MADVGTITYNGCIFSPLFESKLSGAAVKDNAERTIKYVRYTLTVDGYVTLLPGNTTINPSMSALRTLLTAQGGALTYTGRGFDLIVNPPGGKGIRDVAWGPVPKILEFQPLGAGASAKIVWQVEVCIPEILANLKGSPKTPTYLLQFNYDVTVSYAEDGFSTIFTKGVLEIPNTRIPSQTGRQVFVTVDQYRQVINARIMDGIDLERFRVTRRNFTTSLDKRTLEWDFVLEEKPFMDLPLWCTVARGTYNVRPVKAGMGLCQWLCTLKANYVVRADTCNRAAWYAFLALMRLRMLESQRADGSDGPTVKVDADGLGGGATVRAGAAGNNQNPPQRNVALRLVRTGLLLDLEIPPQVVYDELFKQQTAQFNKDPEGSGAFLVDFSFDEGLYNDSKNISFSATWQLVTEFSYVLLASGLWKKLPEYDKKGFGTAHNLWAISMKDVAGVDSWLKNRTNPANDIIVDFGS